MCTIIFVNMRSSKQEWQSIECMPPPKPVVYFNTIKPNLILNSIALYHSKFLTPIAALTRYRI